MNPYVTSRPIGDEKMFFGRKEVFTWLAENLLRGRRIFVLYGPKRIGKTSLLRQLPRHLPSHYIPLQLQLKIEGRPDADALLRQVVADLRRKLREEGWLFLSEPAWEDSELNNELKGRQLSSVADRLLTDIEQKMEDQTLVLIFDNVDALLEDEVGRELFWSFAAQMAIRLDKGSSQCFIFALDETDSSKWESFPLLDHALHIRLGPLEKEEAAALVTRPVERLLDCDPRAVSRILELTSGHPYFLQLFCYLLFNRCFKSGRYVGLHDVGLVLDDLLELEISYFEGLWKASTAREKLVLAALGVLREGHGIATRQEVGNALRKQGARISQTEVNIALESLVRRGVLERLGALSYRFSVDMFRVWLGRRKEVGRVIEEVQPPARGPAILPRSRREFSFMLVALIVLGLAAFGLWRLIAPPGPGAEPTATSSPLPSPTLTPTPEEVVVTPIPTPLPAATPTVTPPLVVARPIPSIAYMVKVMENAPWQIYVMDSNGANPMRLTDTMSNETAPIWSPDGSKIAFVSDRNGDRDIYAMNNDGSEAVNLTDNAADDLMPAWSPDGEQIAFVSRRDGNWEIYVMEADGAEVVRLTYNEADDWTPAWSPDGDEIAFASNRDGNWEIYLINSDGSYAARLTYNSATDISPAWSPRGDRMAFETTRDGDAEIYLMRTDGSGQTNLSRDRTADDHWPSWAPDGARIAFCSNRRGDNWDIFVMSDQGSDVVNLTEGSAANEQGPAWRP